MNPKEQADQLRLAAGILETGHPFETAPKPQGLWAKPMPHERDIMKWPLDKWEIRIILATPPDGRPLHNPDNLTADQVGVGYRLLLPEELDQRHKFSKDGCHWWSKTYAGDEEKGEGWAWTLKGTAGNKDTAFRLPLSVPWPEPEPEFQLPQPPPGIEWHRKDGWKPDDLPQGYRPLVFGERRTNEDEWTYDDGNGWRLVAHYGPEGEVGRGAAKHRTTRPLEFQHLGKTWTWHKPGDPMPCDGEHKVHILCKNLTTPNQIIGWRYAEPVTKTMQLGPEDCPPNSVFRAPEWNPHLHITPSLIALNGVTWLRKSMVDSRAIAEYLSFHALMEGGWQINRPANRDADGNPTKWEPCSKEVAA